VSDDKHDFEQADAAAHAALEYARSLPPGIRSQAIKAAGKLRSDVDRLRPPRLLLAGAGQSKTSTMASGLKRYVE
jgi:hypothetical protein